MSLRSSIDCSRIPYTRASRVHRRWRIAPFTPPTRTIHRRRWRYITAPSTSGCISHWRRRSPPSRRRTPREILGPSPTSEAAYDTAQQGQDYEAPNPRSKSDDERFILINPANNLTTNSGTLTNTVGAHSSTAARGAVEEVLFHRVTDVGPKLRRCAGYLAIAAVASVCVIA